ncbi:hypothetical protein H2198_002610 [Neophaeococcomyces mojaviensis]|uniref:Uncharacterized protein n=1 Tax=Neophaeococcomyces mojaviensis TaxID=3383035 RepID=A0ACC3AE27_9EURO|nr:hypothetical protein H2198_002610 [Knufia sp. JES_112]
MSGTQIPTLKVDSGALDAHVKLEDVASPSPSAVSDTYMDDADLDDPELDFKQAYQNLWLSKLPKHLWETLAKLGDDDEIEIGTIRVEGSMDTPHRVSLKLNEKSPLFQSTEKEYILKAPDQSHRRIKRPGQVMMFSEKDKAGYKKRANVWDNIDEDGNPGQGRSQLYENIQKDEKKKENKGKPWQYRPRKPIPKITALAGTVSQEFEAVAVENAEHKRLEQQRTQDLLRPKEKDSIKIGKVEAKTQYASVISSAERSRINAAANIKRKQLKDNRTARWSKEALIAELFQKFRQHRYWGLNDLKISIGQPMEFVRATLEEIAIMHRSGDFNGKWELKDVYKQDEELLNAAGEAPKLEESDVDMKSEGDDDMDFEDVDVAET